MIYFIFFIFIFQLLFLKLNSQILNRIISLGNHPYRYNHFSFNSNGDMIVDTGVYPPTLARKFFGIKKDGRKLFLGGEDYFSYLEIPNSEGRIEGESFFVKVKKNYLLGYNWEEYLVGISRVSNNKFSTEFYNLDNGKFKSSYNFKSKDILGNITSYVFSILHEPKDSGNNNYYISYIASSPQEKFIFFTNRLNFLTPIFSSQLQYNKETLVQLEAVNQTITSCFFTKNNIYTCFYTNKELNLIIWSYTLYTTKTGFSTTVYTFTESYTRRFFKGIHYKNEIGVFAYFKDNDNNPTFSLFNINYENPATIYKSYGEIVFNQGTFYNIEMLNDLIKLNDNNICFVGSSSERKKLKIIVLNFYDNDNYMNIRYYQIDIWEENGIKIFFDLKINLYNNILVMAFSHCYDENCDEDPESNSKYYSSLIFFNYANNTDINFDIIEYIYKDNKNIENDIIINFEDYLIIQNNLFGYVFKGTKIISFSDKINLIKGENKTINNEIINPGELLQLKIKNNGLYIKANYTIQYAFILTEPNYGTPNDYLLYIGDNLGNRIKDERHYYQKHEYIGKTSTFNIIIRESLTNSCSEDICSLCYITENTCITCKYTFAYNENNNTKTCFNLSAGYIGENLSSVPINNQISEITYNNLFTYVINKGTDKNKDESDNISNILKCANEEVISGKCGLELSNEQIQSFYEDLKNNIKANTSQIISTKNAIFQISSLSKQKNEENLNISSIDLGECEKILKNLSNLPDDEDLIVYKIDLKNEDKSITYIQYEIYNPRTLELISLDPCKNISITIDVPISLNENTQSIYNSLNQLGYNLFDLTDDFYNDICSTYTTENGTDLTLADRKNLIYDSNGKITMCQEGCNFQLYNLTTKKSQCDCVAQTSKTIIDIDEIDFEHSSISDEFYDTLNNSNFRILKCFNLVFSKKGQKNNIGSYIMSSLCFIFLILLLIYIIKENTKLNNFIKSFLKQKFDYSPKKHKKIQKFNKTVGKNYNRKRKKARKKRSKKDDGIMNKSNEEIKPTKKIKNKKILKSFPPKKKVNNSRNSENRNFKSTIYNLLSKSSRTDDDNKKENKILEQKTDVRTTMIIKTKQISNNKIFIEDDTNDKLEKSKIEDMNDEQINKLEYEIALIIDKRTYFQYYFSLLKKKQLFLFAFYPNNDYNLTAVKISLLILSFSLYFTINGFFFSDSTMNKINENHGKYNLLFRIPQILYSTIISAIINIILKWLSLSEKQILSIKKEKHYSNAINISNSIIKCLKVKITIFFLLSFLLMLFFWYFISCFCAVYKNTQKILIIDTLISFGLSMIYPFGLNLIPGFFRIPALRDKDKNKKYLYTLSGYLALI